MDLERVSASMSFMQAIFNIKAAWSGFSKLWKQHSHALDQLDPETRLAERQACRHLTPSSCSLHFGYGMIILVCSFLPPRASRVASLFGFLSEYGHLGLIRICEFCAVPSLPWSS
jgi:hypothetical protein